MSDASSKQPVIPADWDAKPLSWAISGLRAGVSVNSDPDAKVADGRPSVLKTSAIFAGRLNLQERKPIIAKELGRARSSLQAGTILISRMNTPALVGECGYVATDEPDVFLPDRIWMTEFNAIRGTNSRWLASVLSSNTMRSRLKEIATGTSGSMKNIAKGALLSQEILFPPPKEQEAIAEALSDADALIEGLERLIAKKRLIKQGAMQDLLTAKRRLPGFSGEWETRPLGQIGKFKNGINKPTDAFGSGFPFVNLADVFGVTSIFDPSALGLVETTPIERRVYDVCSGDVLFIRSSVKPSGVGLTALVEKDLHDAVFSGFILRFRDSGQLTNAYKRHCFHEASFRASVVASSTVSANTNINQTALRALEITYPASDEEQNAIGGVLSDMDAEIQALETRLEKARQVKEGMMQNLLTGRIRLV